MKNTTTRKQIYHVKDLRNCCIFFYVIIVLKYFCFGRIYFFAKSICNFFLLLCFINPLFRTTAPLLMYSQERTPSLGRVSSQDRTPSLGRVSTQDRTPSLGRINSQDRTPSLGRVTYSQERTPSLGRVSINSVNRRFSAASDSDSDYEFQMSREYIREGMK